MYAGSQSVTQTLWEHRLDLTVFSLYYTYAMNSIKTFFNEEKGRALAFFSKENGATTCFWRGVFSGKKGCADFSHRVKSK